MSDLPKTIRQHYGGKTSEAINRAIRAECPGGAQALELLTALKSMCDRYGWEGDGGGTTPIAAAYERALEVVDAMEDAVRRRWGVGPRPERDDLRRGGRRRGRR